MKKLKVLILTTIFILFFGVLFAKGVSKTDPINDKQQVNQEDQKVLLIIENPDEKLEFEVDYKDGITALDTLIAMSDEHFIDLETTYYEDFDSTLVDSINGFENSEVKSWIYFVNGNSANIGADKYYANRGDRIEWKYIEPNF